MIETMSGLMLISWLMFTYDRHLVTYFFFFNSFGVVWYFVHVLNMLETLEKLAVVGFWSIMTNGYNGPLNGGPQTHHLATPNSDVWMLSRGLHIVNQR